MSEEKKDLEQKEMEKAEEKNLELEEIEQEEEKEIGQEKREQKEKKQELEDFNQEEEIEGKSKKKANKEKTSSMGGKIKASFQSRMFRNGGYSMVIVLAVIILAVFVNLFTAKLDLKVDMSSEGLYTLTEETEKIVEGMKDDIEIYYVVQEGSEDTVIQEILERYDKLSDKITVSNRDPVKYPKFVGNYTSEESNRCVIVENKTTGASKFINYTDLINAQMDYQTYQTYVTDIDVEGQVSSAIQLVSSEDTPVIYQVTGHGEGELNSALTKSIAKLNVDFQTMESITLEEIPEDCDMLIINGPTMDFTEEETTMIENYLKNGGNAAIFLEYTDNDMTNFNSLLAYYGITQADGIVVETSGHYMGNYQTYLLPDIKTGHEIVTSVNNGNKNVIMPLAKGLSEEKVRDTIEFTNFLLSSNDAYSKVDISSNTVAKEKGDIDGPFYLGIAAEESYNDKKTKLAVFASSVMLEQTFVATNQFGNQDLLLDSINWMVDHEAGLNIPTRNIEQQYVSVQPAQIGFWAVLLIGILPIIILVVGIVIWMRRRKA